MFPIIPANSVAADSGNSEGIFGFGSGASPTAITNLVSDTGVVATDVAGVGGAVTNRSACEYGGDKGIFGYGDDTSGTNLVSNVGVVATDTAGVGTARRNPAACGYGGDKGIFGYGGYGFVVDWPALYSLTNLVSNTGVVGTDVAGVGTARQYLAACEYGEDKGIFGYGWKYSGPPAGTWLSITNLVSNAGVVATDTAGVGTARTSLAACSYGGDKGIFGFGNTGGAGTGVSTTNLVSNVGVVATNTAGVGSGRQLLSATQYGGDKGIFGFGYISPTNHSMTNLVSNTGVVASDTAGVGTTRRYPAACSFN